MYKLFICILCVRSGLWGKIWVEVCGDCLGKLGVEKIGGDYVNLIKYSLRYMILRA